VPPANPTQFRQLLGRFATGVTVVTALDAQGRPAGMTATAVSSVSLEPPVLLVCVGHQADFHPVIAAAPRFAVNVLAAGQEHLSRRFAASNTDRFAGVQHRPGPHDVPLLEGVVAHILCDTWGRDEAGDHTVVFGLVTGGETFERPPLLYYRGRYTSTREQR
jgi:flavin reductase (DIM6/NTAB) family NADH-FMN oxidoreductase RutF